MTDYWTGLTCCWWFLAPASIYALPAELAAAWHDDGTRAVYLGDYADAVAARDRLYAEPAEPAEPVAVPAVAESRFEGRAVA